MSDQVNNVGENGKELRKVIRRPTWSEDEEGNLRNHDEMESTLEFDFEKNAFLTNWRKASIHREEPTISVDLNRNNLGAMEESECTCCSFLCNCRHRAYLNADLDLNDDVNQLENSHISSYRYIDMILNFIVVESSWLFLAVLGALSAILAWSIDEAVSLLLNAREAVVDNVSNSIVSYLVWSLFSMVLALFAVISTQVISPLAAGSGIPQMRSVLGGFSIPGYLSFRTLLAKIIGLLLALGSGLVIGKEGPFVHISCIIGNQMFRLPLFRELSRSAPLRKQILAAACAVGVSSTFGAPIGGVLFSIEVTSSLYQTSDYWKAFFCVVCGAFVFKELAIFGQSRNSSVSLFETKFDPLPYGFLELPVFVLVSAVCGYLGGFFVLLHTKVTNWRHEKSTFRIFSNIYSYALIVAFVTSALNYPFGDFMQNGLNAAIDDLFSASSLAEAPNSPNWTVPSAMLNLPLFAVIKLLLCILAVNVSIPCGIFTPVFVIGAAIGRFVGELIVKIGFHDITAGGYALVGAASFTAGATGTVSTAVIVFELTNQLSYMLPVLLSVLVGHACARRVSVSIYESLAISKKLPYFPQLRKQSSYSRPVTDFMTPATAVIERYVDKGDIEKVLQGSDNTSLDRKYLFGIVDSVESLYLIGGIAWNELHNALQSTVVPLPGSGAKADLFQYARMEYSLYLDYRTTMYEALNMFDLHKEKECFVVKRGKLVGKLYLKNIVELCNEGRL